MIDNTVTGQLYVKHCIVITLIQWMWNYKHLEIVGMILYVR